MNISALIKSFVFLSLVAWTLSCQQPAMHQDAPEVMDSNFAVHMEVAKGTPGSMEYSDPVEGAEGIWFGEAQTFKLSYAGLTQDQDGEVAIAFEIVHTGKMAFSDLTEANLGQHMAIEVDGNLICAPIVQDRLPGAGLMRGSSDSWNKTTAEEIVYSLKTGGQKRE